MPVQTRSMSSKTFKLNPNAKEFVPLQDQFMKIRMPDSEFRQVCQFSYKDYAFCIDWDEENDRAILYGNIKYTWQCPDMPIRDIIDWWCDCKVDYYVNTGTKSALNMLVSKAPLCSFDVKDAEYDILGFRDSYRCSLRERW